MTVVELWWDTDHDLFVRTRCGRTLVLEGAKFLGELMEEYGPEGNCNLNIMCNPPDPAFANSRYSFRVDRVLAIPRREGATKCDGVEVARINKRNLTLLVDPVPPPRT